MKGSCIILCFFLAGVLVGRLDIVPDAIARGDLASWALYLLLFVVGMGIGFDTRSWRILRELHIKVALVPLAVMGCGTPKPRGQSKIMRALGSS